MDSITLAPEIELPTRLEEVDAHWVYAAFEKITDGRCKRGRRYWVALISPAAHPVARCLHL